MAYIAIINMAKACEMAALAHSGQYRKGNGEPYINHPIRVARMVSKAGIGHHQDLEKLVIAAILHDTVEDTNLTLEDIEKIFGATVRTLVDGCTDAPKIKKLPRLKRKAAQAEKLRPLSRDVQLIKLADQVDNLESLFKTLESFEPEDATSRVKGMLLVSQTCENADRILAKRAEKTARKILDELSDKRFDNAKNACPNSRDSGKTQDEEICP